MIAFTRKMPHKWSEYDRVAKGTPQGWGIHAILLDIDIGPLLQVQKLATSVHFARAKGYAAPLSAAELELMNLTGDGNGIDMVMMPQEMRERVPTSNFFQPQGYARNPVARRTATVAGLDRRNPRPHAAQCAGGRRARIGGGVLGPSMIDIASGHPAIDRYLADGYGRVRGMSSRFSAAHLRASDPPPERARRRRQPRGNRHLRGPFLHRHGARARRRARSRSASTISTGRTTASKAASSPIARRMASPANASPPGRPTAATSRPPSSPASSGKSRCASCISTAITRATA